MSRKINVKILLQEIKKKIQEFYPYFLSFYIFSLFVSIFSKTWKSFFYWPAFHGSIIFFSLLLFLTFKFKFKFRRIFKINRFELKNIFRAGNLKLKQGWKIGSFIVIDLVKKTSRQADRQFRQYLLWLKNKLVRIKRRAWMKIFIIAVILIFALFKEIDVINFLVLLYALISFLFILDSRYSAAAALIFLAACPFLLIFKKDALAENAAIYAYYFLVITVLTQIIELYRDSRAEKRISSIKKDNDQS
ncbi:MAG: hypothetical protein WC928_04160 [Patescibacteria group bacterium]|jgi:hypothetical protein